MVIPFAIFVCIGSPSLKIGLPLSSLLSTKVNTASANIEKLNVSFKGWIIDSWKAKSIEFSTFSPLRDAAKAAAIGPCVAAQGLI